MLRHQLAGLQTQHSWAMMAGFAPQTCTRTCCHLAAPFPASLLPGARFRAAHPPRPHVGSGVHRRGGLGWVKGRRAYEQSPGPIVSRAGTRLRSPCGAATRQAQADSHNRFNTFVKVVVRKLQGGGRHRGRERWPHLSSAGSGLGAAIAANRPEWPPLARKVSSPRIILRRETIGDEFSSTEASPFCHCITLRRRGLSLLRAAARLCA